MQNNGKGFSTAAFGLAVFCFFLPFVSVSCQQQPVARFSGIQMVTGTTVEQPQMFGPPKSEKFDGDPLAFLAFFCAIGGLA